MTDRKRGMKLPGLGLRFLGTLILLASGWSGVVASVTDARQGQTSDVAIFTNENGQPAYDACYVLVDFSNEGCDENRDGKITFQDVPLGTYTVHQTADLGPGRWVDDFTIEVRGNAGSAGWEEFSATIVTSSGSSSNAGTSGQSGAVDIALITRDPETGDPLTGTCYVLVDHSNEGCDENGDGQVTFADIPYGDYTVHQTQTPAGYPTIDDYDITVEPVTGLPATDPFGVPLGFIVKQAPEQNAPESRNVSVVLIDMHTHEKVVADVCVELVGASNVGCDDDVADGQIDFLDVPAGGPYELRFTNLPAGYEVGTVGGPLGVDIDAGPSNPANRMVFVLLAKAPSGADDDAGVERTESEEVAGEDGFTLELDGVSVSGAPGVAPIGTTVRAQLAEHDLPEGISEFADPVGTGVDITLGEGIQPASPLTITFAPDVVSGWDSTSDATNDLVPVVFTSKVEGPGMELADAQLLPDGSVVVTADHLSPFQPALASISGFADWLGEQVLMFMQVRSERPDCVDLQANDLGWQFSAVPNQLLWTCAEETAGGLEVTFTNNSPEVWFVASDQATPGYPVMLSPTGIALTVAALQFVDRGTTAPIVPPNAAASFSVHGRDDEIGFHATLNAPLTTMNAIVSAISAIVPQKKFVELAELLEKTGRAECFVDIVSTALTGPVEVNGSFAGTIIRCLGSLVGDMGGILISAVAAIPGAVTAVVDTVARELIGNDEFSITLSRFEEVPDEPTQGWAEMDIGARGPNGHEIGARFTVTREDGTFLGSCTLEGNSDEPYPLSCYVSVPKYTTVVVTLDESTITPGFAPVENPLYFDTSGNPGAASHWGVSFQIEPQGSSSASAWPSDRDDGPPSLFVWLGANMYGFPDWVACDDASTYCLVGYPGGEHLLLQMSGLVVIGEVEDSATDPRQKLLALGLPNEIVDQILGP